MTDEKITIELTPQVPTENRELGWHPPGARIELEDKDGWLCGEFQIGDFPIIHVRLQKKPGSGEAVLELDTTGNGAFESPARLSTAAEKYGEKAEYGFDHCLELRSADGRSRSYPISLWHVDAPDSEDELLRLRWTRMGWHQGEFAHCDGESCVRAYALIVDDDSNGVFEGEGDAWALNTSEDKLRRVKGRRPLNDFVWLNGAAYHVLDVDRDGCTITIEQFDPGVTPEEDARNRDPYSEDREAPKAPKPVSFETDLNAALASAKSDGKRVLVDFTATWCGPCRMMEQLVFTAQAVVDVGTDVVFVKIYENEHRDLVKDYEVQGYPTLILLDSDGQVLRREIGYQSVAKLVEFLK